MKIALCSVALGASFLLSAHADLTIVYSSTVQPAAQAAKDDTAPASNVTIKIKGDKARIDASPKLSTIVDGTTGEVVNLMNEQKTVVRISREKVKAVTEMLNKFAGNNQQEKEGAKRPKLTPTGQKETINGYETEKYTYDGPNFKATYWVAQNYPDGPAILGQLQSIKSEFWDAANAKMPDFRDFPGLPIRTQLVMSKEETAPEKKRTATPSGHASGHGTEVTSTITSVNREPISDSEFTVPNDFKEPKLPDIFEKKNTAPSVSPNP
jgi:Domain of unknown function (DUF4412)